MTYWVSHGGWGWVPLLIPFLSSLSSFNFFSFFPFSPFGCLQILFSLNRWAQTSPWSHRRGRVHRIFLIRVTLFCRRVGSLDRNVLALKWVGTASFDQWNYRKFFLFDCSESTWWLLTIPFKKENKLQSSSSIPNAITIIVNRVKNQRWDSES